MLGLSLSRPGYVLYTRIRRHPRAEHQHSRVQETDYCTSCFTAHREKHGNAEGRHRFMLFRHPVPEAVVYRLMTLLKDSADRWILPVPRPPSTPTAELSTTDAADNATTGRHACADVRDVR